MGISVLFLKDRKNTATLQSMMKDVMENVGKIGNCFHRKQNTNGLCSSSYNTTIRGRC